MISQHQTGKLHEKHQSAAEVINAPSDRARVHPRGDIHGPRRQFIAIFTRFDALNLALAEEKIYSFLLTAGVFFLLKWLIVDASFSLMHRHTAAPMMRTLVAILLYFGAGLFLLNKLLGINIFALFTTSAVLTGIIALSLQDTMKNLFTGFGEMSLLTGEPRKATVVAKEDTVCIVVGGRAFHSIFRENPELSETISTLMAKRTAELEDVK